MTLTIHSLFLPLSTALYPSHFLSLIETPKYPLTNNHKIFTRTIVVIDEQYFQTPMSMFVAENNFRNRFLSPTQTNFNEKKTISFSKSFSTIFKTKKIKIIFSKVSTQKRGTFTVTDAFFRPKFRQKIKSCC